MDRDRTQRTLGDSQLDKHGPLPGIRRSTHRARRAIYVEDFLSPNVPLEQRALL